MLSVRVIDIGNGIDDPNSNPGQVFCISLHVNTL